jgi:glycerol-3-phosphate cytidylyltransferase/D-beta-D-heptose 7-phosphate kinase/D-beta-D-heptose 1-phosphate adenosyltransferase
MKVIILSGFFNPLHGGHLDMIEAAAKMGDRLVVIVNNDAQQLLKKGKIILDQDNRTRLIRALRDVDEVVLSIDNDPPVINTLEFLAKQYHGEELVFANGGDRDSVKAIPETEVCEKYGIELKFGVGTDIRGLVKPDSSTRINQELGLQD